MKLPILKLTALAWILTGAAWTASSALVASSSGAEYSFREPPLNSLGLKSLAELRGKPIVIDFWGKR